MALWPFGGNFANLQAMHMLLWSCGVIGSPNGDACRYVDNTRGPWGGCFRGYFWGAIDMTSVMRRPGSHVNLRALQCERV